jgi:hypothetical protein
MDGRPHLGAPRKRDYFFTRLAAHTLEKVQLYVDTDSGNMSNIIQLSHFKSYQIRFACSSVIVLKV